VVRCVMSSYLQRKEAEVGLQGFMKVCRFGRRKWIKCAQGRNC
jgi:hypothetical protein